MPSQILIVGLREVGMSIGLALRQAAEPPTIFGYDTDKAASAAALEAGAYERRVLDPRKTAAEVDLVVLALPAAEAGELVGDLASALKPGANVLDLTAQAHPPDVASSLGDQPGRVIRGVPVVSAEQLMAPEPPSSATPDMFRGGSFGLAISPDTPEPAIELALSVADALGTSPFFIDPAELEYLWAALDLLPALLGLMIIQTLAGMPGWENVQRLAGRPLAAYVDQALGRAEQLTEHLWHGRASLLAQLGSLSSQLATLEDALSDETSEQLASIVDQALEARDDWLRVRQDNRPRSSGQSLPPTRGILGNLFGFSPRRPPDDDQD